MKRLGKMKITAAAALFVIGVRAAAPQEEVLYSFASAYPGAAAYGPQAGLISDSNGNLYGTDPTAVWGFGTVFELTHVGAKWEGKVLYAFCPDYRCRSDGNWPEAGLVFDPKGDVYGTTSGGGSNGGYGTVFELTPAEDGGWTEEILHSFGATSSDGREPQGGLIFDAKGNLYGTTSQGGIGCGTVFELMPAADGSWAEKVLHSFGADNPNDGCDPLGGLVFDTKGNLYGTTWIGSGSNGMVYELTPAASGEWVEKVLCNLGYLPYAGVVLDSEGNLLGTTAYSGPNGNGSVFELRPARDGTWTEEIIYNFGASETDGSQPFADLVFDRKGNLYGATEYGGRNGKYGDGTVFELTRDKAGIWTEKVLHNFGASSDDGIGPDASLLLDETGDLYGTTTGGGKYGFGTAFEIESVITAHAPQFSLSSGPYLKAQTVRITDTTPDAAIYYTTNGDTPTTSSEKYTEPIEISESETIKAIAEAKGLTNSAIATAVYEIDEPAAKPVFSEPGKTYTSAQTVKLSDATPESTIQYTTNGKTPTTSSAKYTAAIKVSASETIKAIAVAKGYRTSAVASEDYVIK